MQAKKLYQLVFGPKFGSIAYWGSSLGLDGSLQVVFVLFQDHGVVFGCFVCEAEIKLGHVWFATCSGDEFSDYMDQVNWPDGISGYLWVAVIGQQMIVIGQCGAVIVRESTVSAQALIWGWG